MGKKSRETTVTHACCAPHILRRLGASWTRTRQRCAHVPVGFVYSKSTVRCVWFGFLVRSLCVHKCACLCVSCKLISVHTQTGWSSDLCVCVFERILLLCMCMHVCMCVRTPRGWWSTSPRQTNPWAIITSSPQLKCLSYFIYAWYTSVFPKTMESL